MNVKRLFSFFVMMCCFLAVFAAGKHKYTLVIDAGHGGKDAGACANHTKEKTINLNVALAFGRYVEHNCPDVKVIYTRKTDVFIPLHERAAIANRNKADVFISIHTNSLPGKKPKAITGMETYTMGIRRSDEKLSAAMRENEVILIEKDYQQYYSGYDPKSPESTMIFEIINEENMAKSVELANLIQKHTCRLASRPNKGVRQDAFLVLRETSMPACLVELGYITTPSEAAYLTNRQNVDRLGRGIYQAFVAFKNKYTGSSTPVEAAPLPPSPKPEKAQQSKSVADSPVVEAPAHPAANTSASQGKTVFKVQLFASDEKLKAKDRRFKGLTGVDSYKEGKLWKYTIGSAADYAEIYALRKQVANKFPQAFIVAFRDGQRVDASGAHQEFLRNKKKISDTHEVLDK
jgi:N-acetylmuramoyl-L-alanine amidase